ncbi:MAG: 30S ribosomal protein S11 [Parcubacteria group bacterium]|nr:30S ribosomal protein S11 [Parcubacteria group bacterium]MCR4342975.1 30S ribosomal protein S11 [Patescibacteria group bacterium]
MANIPKKKISKGIINILSTYNNTLVSVSDDSGGVLIWSSSGSLGFKGAKKGTPFAASKVAEVVADKASIIGLKEADVIVRGVGAGRDSAIRTFASRGIEINSILDTTPVPHNGPKAKKPRRV